MLRDHTHEAPNALHIVVVIFVVSSNCFFQFRSALSFSVYLLHAVCHFMCAGQSRFVYTCSSMPEFLQCLTYCKDQRPFRDAEVRPAKQQAVAHSQLRETAHVRSLLFFCIRFFFFAYHHLCRWTLKYNADDDVLMNAQSVILAAN